MVKLDRDVPFFGTSGAGLVTSDMRLDGGVIIIDETGRIVKNIKDREDLPLHARIQPYSEAWLEQNIEAWGKALVSDHEVSWGAAVLPWQRSPRRLGIDDDVRVVVDPDTGGYVQYILLDSRGSTTNLLRGAIKANVSGLFYYNWEKFGYIDTNSAKDHVQQAVIDVIGTSQHGYKTLLPILYPVKENVTSLSDYAYVVTLQLGESRFGGIAITDPSDKTGTRTVIEFAASESTVDVPKTLDKAIERYLQLVSDDFGENLDGTEMFGTLQPSERYSYVSQGVTVIVY
ncbi:MAG: hypothetical protein IH840_06470, partial [Candidatus Heimdallarchaeota archaeon]|nr:hypothetical protein [Candidatus Heimdallarchaeota archaeon]